jgi:hypothetical protein
MPIKFLHRQLSYGIEEKMTGSVQWAGKLPSITSVVKVKGAVRDTEEGKFLFAESVEAVGK